MRVVDVCKCMDLAVRGKRKRGKILLKDTIECLQSFEVYVIVVLMRI